MEIIELISKIANDKTHALHPVIDFYPDLKSIVNFEGKTQLIVGNGRNCAETLGREILMQTFLRNQRNLFSTEDIQDNRSRSDLIGKIEGVTFSIVECKQIPDIQTYNVSKFNKLIDDGLQQLKLYTESLTIDTYVSLCLMDLEKIINEPLNIDLFNKSFDNEKRNSFECFKKYGIYIHTLVYSPNSKELIGDIQHEFPQMSMFDFQPDALGCVRTTIPISRAIMLPTSSPKTLGIQNVREVINPSIDFKKKELTYSILDTVKRAFKEGEQSIISSAGCVKSFLLSRTDSIIKKDEKHLYISALSAAVVDGQNSIDSFKVILEIIQQLIDKKYQHLTGFDKLLADSILLDFKTQDEQERLFRFLETCSIPFDINTAKDSQEAREVAISKNRTMPVKNNELKSSSCQEELQMLAYDLLTRKRRLIFPKSNSLLIDNKTDNKIVTAEFLVKILSILDIDKKTFVESNKKIGLLGMISGKTKAIHYDVLKKIIHRTDVSKNNPDRKLLDLEIKNISSSIKDAIKDINDLETIMNPNNGIIEMIEGKKVKLDEMEEKRALLINKMSTFEELSFELKNTKETIDPVFDAIVKIRERTSFNMKLLSEQSKDVYDIVRSVFRKEDSASDHIFGLFVLQDMKRSSRKKNTWMKNLSNEDIDKMFEKMKEGFLNVRNNFDQVSIVMIKNKASDDTVFTDNSGKPYTLGEIRNMYINV